MARITAQIYLLRYNSAMREIENLRRLTAVGWKGIPLLAGVCVGPYRIIYVVERVPGHPLCKGDGTDAGCVLVDDVMKHLKTRKDFHNATLTWLVKVSSDSVDDFLVIN